MSIQKHLMTLACCLPLVFATACDDDGDAADAGSTGGAGGAVVDMGQGGAGGTGGTAGTSGVGGTAGEGGMGGTAGAGGVGGTAGEGGTGGSAPVCELHDAPCEDEQFLELGLKEIVASGAVTNTETDGIWTTKIDATAGVPPGTLQPATESFTYLQFTEAGLEKLHMSDEDAFGSDMWDLAVRRYVMRLNGGMGGPGCVTGARMPPAVDFMTFSEVPEAANFFEEAYMTADSCEMIPDGSGLPSPSTVLASFWSYTSCVTMTGNVYVIDLADGRRVKFQVEHYYSEANQASCQDSGSAGRPSNSGNVGVRWAYLP